MFLTNLGSSLLSFAQRFFGPGLCPGEWVWATIGAGMIIGLLPALGSLLVTLVRKGTGNAYNAATISVFAATGGFFTFLMPLLFAIGISEVFVNASRGTPSGLTGGQVESVGKEFCGWVGPQDQFLGRGARVYDVLFYPHEGAGMLFLRILLLVALPGIGLLFIWLQARAAMRRGPRWPGRLLWLPFVAMVVLTLPMTANSAGAMWLGFVPMCVLGMIPLLIAGPPSWSVIERSHQRPPPYVPPAQQQQQPPPPYVPPPPQPARMPPPMRAANQQPEPETDRAALAKLAEQPGPLPFGGGPPRAPTGLWQNNGGRFQKIKQLGQGGFGTVWLAKDTQLDRTVAVKLAHAPDAEAEARMLREARALAAVHHPNCVRVYDIVSDADGLGLVMEYIEGEQLADSVHGGGVLTDVQAARLWVTMAGALTAAHAKGVLHRDVKPANVIIDPNGMAHLIDFGIARAKGDSTLTSAGMMVGTPDFLAPETAGGSPATPASDAWQLAATVSFALAGAPPRGVRENAMAALMAAARSEPLTQLPGRSAHLRLLTASLDADPGRRPTLAAVSREMSAWLARSGQGEEGPVTKIVHGTRPLH
ncbi:serine/threonine-protein kinase [Actinophytocola sp.]|uniref:serine/threonine-protein kinase n=1 Tax=Actinophytocola sp. TaxID=1872138 RepID=UPI003D6C184D